MRNLFSMGQSPLGREAKAQAFSLAIQLFTGQPPILDRQENFTEISFTPEQVQKIQSLLKQWHDAEPGEIRVNVKPVLLPFYLKKYGIYLAGIALGGILLGRMFR